MNALIQWQLATIASIRQETASVKTLTLQLPNPTRNRPGQHYDIRLTAADGYQTQRSYSIASPPEPTGFVEVTVERIEDGEVSTYVHDVVVVGDQVEVRGPVGGYFVWDVPLGGPLLLIAGGSGVVPLMAIIRHRAATGTTTPTRLLYSARTFDDLIYREELDRLAADGSGLEIHYTLTRSQPPGWRGYDRRIDNAMLSAVGGPLVRASLVYICGPTPLVEKAANGVAEIGVPASHIRTERFGPSGS